MTLELLNKMDKESVYIYDAHTLNIVGTLTRHINDACEVYYTLCVDWNAYDALGNVNPIPGYDLALRKDVYIREKSTVFMTEFLPPAVREDSYQLMLSVGIDMPYDMWAFMVEQGRICMDNWRVMRIPGASYEHDKYKIRNRQFDYQSKTTNMPKPGEDWGEQVCDCTNCGCPIWHKDSTRIGIYLCPNCGHSVEVGGIINVKNYQKIIKMACT